MPVGSAPSDRTGTPSSPSLSTAPSNQNSTTTNTTTTTAAAVQSHPSSPANTSTVGSIDANVNVEQLPPSGESTIDAAHIHFRERLGPLQTYHCHTCDDRFQAHSLLAVMEHFVRHSSTCSRFHSACLYCGGKVHSYCLEETTVAPATGADDRRPTTWTAAAVGEAGGGRRYYHDCGRWRRRQDR